MYMPQRYKFISRIPKVLTNFIVYIFEVGRQEKECAGVIGTFQT